MSEYIAMPYNETLGNVFAEWYGASLDEVSAKPELIGSIREQFSRPEEPVATKDHFGRGHVGFGKSVSAKEADDATMRIYAAW